MTLQEAREILADHNRWRRGDETLPMGDPTMIGEAIDIVLASASDEYFYGSQKIGEVVYSKEVCEGGAAILKDGKMMPVARLLRRLMRTIRRVDRRWYMRADGIRRWASNDQPCDAANEADLWRCTICGRTGTVGRCCGEETREPVQAHLADGTIRR